MATVVSHVGNVGRDRLTAYRFVTELFGQLTISLAEFGQIDSLSATIGSIDFDLTRALLS